MRSARLALSTALVLAAAPVAAQTVSASDAARQSFQLGRALYEQRRWSEALDAFRTSQQVLASPNTLLYIGRCHRELGRAAEAYRNLLLAAQQADARSAAEPRYAPTADAARREAGALSARVGFVIIDVSDRPPALNVTLNGESVDPSEFGTAIAVDPGSVVVEASAAGRVPFRGTSAVAASQQSRIPVQLPVYQPGMAVSAQTATFESSAHTPVSGSLVATTTSSPLRPLGITALSTGLALGVAGIFTGLRAQSLQSDLDRMCPSGCGSTRADVRGMVDEGRTMVTLTNVMWGLGGALVVAGAVMWIVAPSSANSGELFTPSFARVRPYLDPMGGAGLVGRF